MIYFDNASTTKICNDAKNELIKLIDCYGNPSSSYKLGRISKKILNDSKKNIAKIMNCDPDCIFFTSGGSEGNSWAITNFVSIAKKKTIITSEFEHSSVLNSVKQLEKSGYNVKYIKPNTDGIITTEALEALIDNDVALVSIMLINNELGTIQPIKKLVEVSHKYGAIFHTDAVQAVGHIKIDITDLNVDLLSASAHKFYGPKGVGFLYKSNKVNMNNLIFGGHQQLGIRPGTENVYGIGAMSKALIYSYSIIEKFLYNSLQIKEELINLLNEYKISYLINGIQNYDGIISITIKGIDNEALVNYLDLNDICISYGSACNTGNLMPSYVLKSIGLSDESANSTIRLSLSYENNVEEIKLFGYYLNEYLLKICKFIK